MTAWLSPAWPATWQGANGKLNAFFGRHNRLVLNRGIGGDTAEGVLRRFEADVIQLKPKCAVLLIGCNGTFDLLGDPVYGRTLRPGLSYEGLHPNVKGYNVMARVLRATLTEHGIPITARVGSNQAPCVLNSCNRSVTWLLSGSN